MKQIQELIKERKQRGYQMAMQEKPICKNGIWLVRSQINPRKTYSVSLTLEGSVCDCEDYIGRGLKCKHAFAVEYTLTKAIDNKGITTITETKRMTYPQNWKAYNMASERQKELYLKLLNDLCNTVQEPIQEGAGRPSMPLRDMIFASGLKVYSTFSLRRFGTDKNDAVAKGYLQKAPKFSTVAYYMRDENLTPVLKGLIALSALPLKAVESSFSIDSSGFTPAKFSRWYDHKYKKVRGRKIWYKAHLVVGNNTQIVCGAEITTEYVGDMNMLPEMVQSVSRNFDMKELTADKGYISDKNLMCLQGLGIQSYIPFKSNTVANNEKKSEIWRNAYNYFCFNQEAFLEHYHQRSNIETAFFMIKSKFGDYTKSKTDTGCVNEILLKILSHNICVLIQEMFELGIEVQF